MDMDVRKYEINFECFTRISRLRLDDYKLGDYKLGDYKLSNYKIIL